MRWAFGAALLLSLTTAARAEEVVIRQHDHVFDPARVKIKAGTTVLFTNAEKVIHHVYVESGVVQFDSGDIPPGGQFSFVFTTPGRAVVRCAIHPAMKAEIEIEN